MLAPHVKPLLSRFSAILGSGEHAQEEVARRVRVLHQAARELKHEHFAVDAWCHLRNDLRSFAVDAIRAAEPLTERAKEISASSLDKYVTSGYGIFAGSKVQWATLRFTPQAARWVAAQNWHPKQKARFEDDGAYRLSIPYSDDRELVMDILKYGPEVEVLEPAALRQRVARQLAAAAKRYR